ncbi:MAG: hypothetical protein ACJAZP_003455 [Psychromonas sp.]
MTFTLISIEITNHAKTLQSRVAEKKSGESHALHIDPDKAVHLPVILIKNSTLKQIKKTVK